MTKFTLIIIFSLIFINMLSVKYIFDAPAYNPIQKYIQSLIILLIPFFGALGITYFLWADRNLDGKRKNAKTRSTAPLTKKKAGSGNSTTASYTDIISKFEATVISPDTSYHRTTNNADTHEYIIYKPYDPYKSQLNETDAILTISNDHKPWVKRTWFILQIALPYIFGLGITFISVTANNDQSSFELSHLLFIWIVLIISTIPYIIIWNKRKLSLNQINRKEKKEESRTSEDNCF